MNYKAVGLLTVAIAFAQVGVARAGVHIDLGVGLVPPPIYYGPPAAYYSPPPPVYYGPSVVYPDDGWGYGGYGGWYRHGWDHDHWHHGWGRGGHGRGHR